MRASKILEQYLLKSLLFHHRARIFAVVFAVRALLVTRKLSMSGMGRCALSSVQDKHTIKRIFRLLSNHRLHKELLAYFSALIHLVLAPHSRPVILIDWTRIDLDFCTLTAAVAIDGRSIPIYWQVHPITSWNKHKVHKRFFLTLLKLLPLHCHPILVADAGFENPWFKLLREHGIDFVGRLMNVKLCEAGQQEWKHCKEFYPLAGRRPRNLGLYTVAKNNRMQLRVILGKRFRRNPNRCKTRSRRKPANASQRSAIARQQQPWLLVTSIQDKPARKIIFLYSLRMQIEQNYRDAKSHRFGFSLEDARESEAKRYEVLLLIASLAMVCLMMLGLAVEKSRGQFAYQSNTVHRRRVLSLFYLGLQVLNREKYASILIKPLRDALREIKRHTKGRLL